MDLLENYMPDWDSMFLESSIRNKNESFKTKENMKHIIAIPLENGTLCSHFGHCQQFAIINVENNEIIGESLITPPPHEPGLLPGWLAERGITDIIAGGIGQKAVDLFMAKNIKVNIGVQPKSPYELVSDWLKNSLVTGVNSCDH